MSEPYENSDIELVSATKNLTRVNDEYESQFASTTPLGSGDTPLIPLTDIAEATNKIQAAEEIYGKALQADE